MLHGPWKDAGAPTLNLQIDDDNINQEAVTMALAYLYGHYPKLNDRNAFRVLAVASFLDLQVLNCRNSHKNFKVLLLSRNISSGFMRDLYGLRYI